MQVTLVVVVLILGVMVAVRVKQVEVQLMILERRVGNAWWLVLLRKVHLVLMLLETMMKVIWMGLVVMLICKGKNP